MTNLILKNDNNEGVDAGQPASSRATPDPETDNLLAWGFSYADSSLYRIWPTIKDPASLGKETTKEEDFAFYVLYTVDRDTEDDEDLCGIFESLESLLSFVSSEINPLYEGFVFFNQAVQALALYNESSKMPVWKDLPIPQASSQPLRCEPVPWTPYRRRDYPNPRSDGWGESRSIECQEPHRSGVLFDTYWVVIVGVCPGVYASFATAAYAAGPSRNTRIRRCPSVYMAQMMWKELRFTYDRVLLAAPSDETPPPIQERVLDPEPKGIFYAVIRGICPGIYRSHDTAVYAAGPGGYLRSYLDVYSESMIWRELALTREVELLPPP